MTFQTTLSDIKGTTVYQYGEIDHNIVRANIAWGIHYEQREYGVKSADVYVNKQNIVLMDENDEEIDISKWKTEIEGPEKFGMVLIESIEVDMEEKRITITFY